MPTYEYDCEGCGYRFEHFQSISATNLSKCPKCGEKVRRLVSGGSGFILKGAGFYVNDYARKPATPDKSPKKAPKQEKAAPCCGTTTPCDAPKQCCGN